MNIVNLRRILHYDFSGIGESLDEVVCVDERCDGLTVYIHIYVYFLQHQLAIVFTTAIIILPHENSYRPGGLTMSISTS